MLSLMVIGAMIASLVHPAAVDDPPIEPPPPGVVIDVVTVNGTGCSPGSVEVDPFPGDSMFGLVFRSYEAKVGVGALPTDPRRNCQISLVVHPPVGYTYAVASTDFRGHVSLAAGANATFGTITYFSGQSATSRQTSTVAGPFDDDASFSTVVDLAALVWAPCGQLRAVNVLTTLQVNAGTSDIRSTTSSVAITHADGVTLHWKRCGRLVR